MQRKKLWKNVEKMNDVKKRRRQAISLETKLTTLNKLEKGVRVFEICKEINFPESTVRTIKKNEENIRGSAASTSSTSLKSTPKCRDIVLENSERALVFWIDKMTSRNVVLTTAIIQQKARDFYAKYSGKTEFEFKASNGSIDSKSALLSTT